MVCFSSRRRHTRYWRDWSSDVCSSDLWSLPLQPDEVAPAQRALDVLDVRLGNHAREDWSTKGRVAATLLALALVSTLDFGWPWIPLLITLVKPTAASVAAMGTMAIGRVIIGALAGTFGATALGAGAEAWLAIFSTFAIGAWCCWIAWRRVRGDEQPTQRLFIVVVLACVMTLIVGSLALARMNGLPEITPPSLPPQTPGGGTALVLLGAGAALVTFRDKLRRRSGMATAAAGLLVGGVSATVERLTVFGTDAPGIAWTTGRGEPRS